MGNYAVNIENITKSYMDGERERTVLDNVNLKVKPAEFVAIVGPSGSGKSTLLSIIGALLSPDCGTVTIGNKEINKKSWTEVRKSNIGFIFQNHQLLPFLTVEEQLKLISSMNKKNQNELEKEILKELGLESKRKKYPASLSGGEKQRVAIARAFMNDPDLILADEPTASLDKERGRQVVDMIAAEVRKRNKAAIMVTHDDRILDLVDTVYYLEGGILSKKSL